MFTTNLAWKWIFWVVGQFVLSQNTEIVEFSATTITQVWILLGMRQFMVDQPLLGSIYFLADFTRKYYFLIGLGMFYSNMLPQRWPFSKSFTTFLALEWLEAGMYFSVCLHSARIFEQFPTDIARWSYLMKAPVVHVPSCIGFKLQLTNIT